ncbi:MAG: TolC family protein [Bacteroidales bacterium]|nr:TolC family protein [Bacteroidales bacterium]
MLKKLLLIFVFIPAIMQAQELPSLKTLFDSLKVNPTTKRDELNMEKALANKNMALGMLYPNIDLFGSYSYANTPSGMLPIAPNNLLAMVKDQTVAQPFSENIFRLGGEFSMPVFVKSIYTMAAKAEKMHQSAEEVKNINLLKNEAMLVGLNANLTYVDALGNALEKKKESILKTKEIIEVKVKSERAPSSALLKIDNGLNQIDLMRNELALNRTQIISKIYALTGITLDKAVDMESVGNYKSGAIKALDPLQKKIEADKLGWRAEKEKLLPFIAMKGNYNHSMAKAYNNNLNISEDFAAIGLALKIPIFSMNQYAKIRLNKVELNATQNNFDKMNMELVGQSHQLKQSLDILEHSLSLYANSIKDKEELLKIAKVAYKSDRLTIEDYLKYEDDLVMEKSKLFKAEAAKWQTLMKLAVIYGNNIESIVK